MTDRIREEKDADFLEKAMRHPEILTPDGRLRLFDCVRDLQSRIASQADALKEARGALELAEEVMDDLGWVEDDDRGQIPACAKALRKALSKMGKGG